MNDTDREPLSLGLLIQQMVNQGRKVGFFPMFHKQVADMGKHGTDYRKCKIVFKQGSPPVRHCRVARIQLATGLVSIDAGADSSTTIFTAGWLHFCWLSLVR
jgi:hypothetical protein